MSLLAGNVYTWSMFGTSNHDWNPVIIHLNHPCGLFIENHQLSIIDNHVEVFGESENDIHRNSFAEPWHYLYSVQLAVLLARHHHNLRLGSRLSGQSFFILKFMVMITIVFSTIINLYWLLMLSILQKILNRYYIIIVFFNVCWQWLIQIRGSRGQNICWYDPDYASKAWELCWLIVSLNNCFWISYNN